MSFYRYRQNNSGGFFTEPALYVFVEAGSAEEADDHAETLGVYFGGLGDCECCGSRWSTAWKSDAMEIPCVYSPGDIEGEYSRDSVWSKSGDGIANVIIAYADGTKDVWVKGALTPESKSFV